MVSINSRDTRRVFYRLGRTVVDMREGFNPKVSANTDKPHEHKREAARRMRQMGLTA